MVENKMHTEKVLKMLPCASQKIRRRRGESEKYSKQKYKNRE